MEISNRIRVMLDLGVTENDCIAHKETVVEKCFCAAVGS